MCDYFAQQRIIEGSSSPAEEGCTCRAIKLSKIIGCGDKFDFMEGDNIYKGICGEDDGLCKSCSLKGENQNE